MASPLVGIVMGSDSDLPIMQEAKRVLDELKIPSEATVASAHRTPDKAHKYASTAAERGLKVIIAGAGGAAHLAGVLAASTTLPVIGVPIDSSSLLGLDALLSTAQMPGGIPVATMAIGKPGAKNAGILAAQIIGAFDPEVAAKLADYKARMAEEVEKKAKSVENLLNLF
ncbi:MAG TPA: 5-(carboxyamino)imidazole ribonucleotide mutase [Nitrospirota bacterium]|nr:5-(carboxyamino)imidazole ribonucleotide mutase [Nitrospirota bacterium]